MENYSWMNHFGSAIFQIVDVAISFVAAITIARYEPHQAHTLNTLNTTHLQRGIPQEQSHSTRRGGGHSPAIKKDCPWGQRKVEIDMGSLEDYLPQFISCPSTATITAAILVFFVGMLTFYRLHKYNKLQNYLVIPGVMQTLITMEWEKPLVWLQQYLPVNILMALVFSALVHILMAPCFPQLFLSDGALQEYLNDKSKRADLVVLEEGTPGLVETTPLLGGGTSSIGDPMIGQ